MSTYEVGPFTLDAEQLFMLHQGRPVALGPKVVETLLALVERPGDVLAKAYLVDRIWPDGFVEEANLAQNIHVLRKAFRARGLPDPIETVARRGYRLRAPVRRGLGESPPREAVDPAPLERVRLAQVVRPAPSRRFAAALAAAAFAGATLMLVASSGSYGHGAAPGTLSGDGERSYQIGRYYWNQRTREGVQKSLRYFAHVVDSDPRSPRGYAALAYANEAMGDYCYGTHRPSVYFARAREYAKKALALDRGSVEAHATLGLLALHRNHITVAVAELRRALALDPSYGPAHEWYGIALLERGRLAEGREHLRTAAALDPLSVATLAWLGKAAYRDGRFGDAILYSREALELSPRRTDVLATIGEAYEAQGDLTRAVAAFNRFGAVHAYYRPTAAALLARAYALGHRESEARAQFDYARAHAADIDPADLAAAAAAVGERSGAGRRLKGHAGHPAMYA